MTASRDGVDRRCRHHRGDKKTPPDGDQRAGAQSGSACGERERLAQILSLVLAGTIPEFTI